MSLTVIQNRPYTITTMKTSVFPGISETNFINTFWYSWKLMYPVALQLLVSRNYFVLNHRMPQASEVSSNTLKGHMMGGVSSWKADSVLINKTHAGI